MPTPHSSPHPTQLIPTFHSFLVIYSMQLSQERFDNVPTLRSRTITLAPSARRRASSPALHPTTLSLVLSIASTRFLTFCEKSEATTNTATHPSIRALAHLSLLFGMLGALIGALTPCPVFWTMYQDQPAFMEGPGLPVSTVVIRSRRNVCMPDVPHHRLPVPPWLIQKRWDCPSMCTFASLSCFTAQVWLYICIYEPVSVQVVSGLTIATAFSVTLRHLRTSPRILPWNC